MSLLTRRQVFEAIEKERFYQDDKWGRDRPQSLPGYLLIAQAELNEAIAGWIKNGQGRSAPLHELTQVAAVIVACLERYGTEGTTINTDDLAHRSGYSSGGNSKIDPVFLTTSTVVMNGANSG